MFPNFSQNKEKMKNIIKIASISIIAISSFFMGCKKDEETLNKPTVTTTSVTNITKTSAVCLGKVNSDGGAEVTERGIYWSLTENPTDSNNTIVSGTGTGEFSCTLTGLSANTTYYFRAYAKNSEGTSYGDVLNFKTNNDNIIEGDPISDNDGNTYKTVIIGTQTWMKENLKTTKFADESLIGTTSPATLYISNDSIATYQWVYGGTESNEATYGRLYTWEAASNSKGICPTGYHLPSNDDWKKLTDYLENLDSTSVGIAKTIASTSGWASSSIDGTIGDKPIENNSSGFSAIPSGYRDPYGTFVNKGTHAYFWTSVEDGSNDAIAHYLTYDNVNEYEMSFNKKRGFSIRCVKD